MLSLMHMISHPGQRARLLAGAATSLMLVLGAGHEAAAQEEQGCCQFVSRSPDGSPSSKGQRRCDDLTRRECSLLKPGSVFLRRWTCDKLGQRCILGVPPSTPTPMATPTRTATPTPTEPRGCCQVNNVRTVDHAICGNDVSQTSCLNETKGDPVFCANCECSSHSVTGFSFDVGDLCDADTDADGYGDACGAARLLPAHGSARRQRRRLRQRRA